jgi:hypothetical protein
MQQSEIIELARQAKTDPKVARGAFRKLAVKEGFNGASGGWIYYRDDTGAITQGWQGLADLVASGTVRFSLAEARPEVIDSANALVDEVETRYALSAPCVCGKRGRVCQASTHKAKPLSPAMQRLVRALDEHGYIDPIRDCDRGTGVSTLVALMDRGIIRESRTRYGVHHKATTPAEVWDEAHDEDARRAAEQAAHAECAEQWLTTSNEDGQEIHTRRTRSGNLVRVVNNSIHSFRSWSVVITGVRLSMSAAGTWQEARLAADRWERNFDHGDALVLDDHADNLAKAGQPMDGSAHLTGNVRVVGGALVSEIPLGGPEREHMTIDPAIGPDFTGGAFTEAVKSGWGQPDGMLGATEAELTADEKAAGLIEVGHAVYLTPTEERTDVTAALDDVSALIEAAELWIPGSARQVALERLSRVAQTLGTCGHARRDWTTQ